jgi:hypothetical protein
MWDRIDALNKRRWRGRRRYINSPSHRAELIKELIGSKEFQEAIANAVEKSRDEGVLEKEDRTKERDGDLEVSNHRI